MTDPTRDDVAKLLEQVSPGPWFCVGPHISSRGPHIARAYSSDIADGEANAALIAIAPFLARQYVSGALGAEAMQNRLIDALASIEVAYVRNNEPIAADAAAKCLDAVLTVSSPSPADLLAAARALPKVQALEKQLTEMLTKVDNDRALWTEEWHIWVFDTKVALAALNGGAE